MCCCLVIMRGLTHGAGSRPRNERVPGAPTSPTPDADRVVSPCLSRPFTGVRGGCGTLGRPVRRLPQGTHEDGSIPHNRGRLVALAGREATMKTLDPVDAASLRDDIPDFRAGDTVKVHVKVVEGNKTRVQVFQGVVIARSGSGASETYTVRKVSYGVGVERTFPLHSPIVEKIEVVTRGDVRRAKLYYLRGLRGKAAKIRERRENSPAAAATAAPTTNAAPLDDPAPMDDPVSTDEAVSTDDAAPSDDAAPTTSEN